MIFITFVVYFVFFYLDVDVSNKINTQTNCTKRMENNKNENKIIEEYLNKTIIKKCKNII